MQSPVLHTATLLMLDNIRYPDPYAAVTSALTSEVYCFLIACNYDAERRDAKIRELEHDLCEIILRSDRPTFVLRCDRSGHVHLHTTTSDDEFRAVVERANADGSFGIARNPTVIREWIAKKYFERH
jgi:hypothetical protein